MTKVSGLTAERVLDVAQELIQTRGYNGFSFRDIAQAIGIKSASIHYHFPSKGDLGVVLVARYRRLFGEELAEVRRRQTAAPKRLKCFIALFRRTLTEQRLCLCGVLAAERGSLPEEVNAEVRAFFKLCEDWLVEVLKDGRAAGEIEFRGPPQALADHLISLLEGAMVMALSLDDLDRFDKAAQGFLRILKPAADG
ncbi:TetR/AcrR family transcriptional regulator [Pelagibius sp. CAU 1746]|uniref:TetR/AcrR family transcriptional regulator n=1 Tax=Pelagibius sp. CAU 1746 TaxID=3140370 RepID=UPI00325A6785